MKIKYNFYSLFLITMSAINLGLLYLVFGLSDQLKLIFIILNTVLLLQTFIQMPVEQIIYFVSRPDANQHALKFFFRGAVCLLILLSSLIWMLCFFIPTFFEFFSGIHELPYLDQRFRLAVFLMLSCPSMSFIFQQHLNFEKKITMSFLLNGIPLIWQFLILVRATWAGGEPYDYLFILSLGHLFSVALGAYLVRHLFYGGTETSLSGLLGLVKESFKFKLAHSVHNVSLNLALNHCAATLTGSQASVLFGVRRFTEACQQVLVIPFSKILPTQFATMFKEGQYNQVLENINLLQKKNFLIFSLCLLIGFGVAYSFLIILQVQIDIPSGLLMLAGYGIYSTFVCLDYPYSIIVSLKHGYQVFFAINLIFLFIICVGYFIGTSLPLLFFLLSIALGQLTVCVLKKQAVLYYMDKSLERT